MVNSSPANMVTLEQVRNEQRARGPATVLAIGTEVPSNFVDQNTFPDYYFRVTNNQHKTELKEKFQRICEKSTVKKRHLYLTEEILKEKPELCEHMAPSLDTRQDILVVETPKLGKEAALKAIEEWGQPKSKITHVVFASNGGVEMPGADYHLTKLLELNPSVKRTMIYMQGCFIGGTMIRLAKDFAENNKNARVLIICTAITAMNFRGPSEKHPEDLVSRALLGDGAGALIIGADPLPVEKPLFELVSAAQTILPESDGVIVGYLREVGLMLNLSKDVVKIISKNIEKALVEAFQPLGISDWNSIFWIAHPGGPAILDRIEAELGLKGKKLRASRQVLSDYGNLSGGSVFFIMDEMRRKSKEAGLKTTGEGLEWGVLFGFGPGITVETVVLRSVAIKHQFHNSNMVNSSPANMVTLEQVRNEQRARGPATVLAIGTEVPSNFVDQNTFPDYYFRVTNNQHKTELKEKFQRMCDKSMVKKRHLYLTEEILKEKPELCEHMAPSLDIRQEILVVETPKLGKEAALKAIEEWGQPKSKITHLVFASNGGFEMPGADYHLTKLLGLNPSVKRTMIYMQGCFVGGTAIRLAKDFAENNKNARVLIICTAITLMNFRGPSETHLDDLVGRSLLGDGAGALIIGADPLTVEKPLFELVSAAQTILPESDGVIVGYLREVGLMLNLSKDIVKIISKNIEKALVEAFQPLGISDWNSIFWIAHPGGPAILDRIEAELGLKEKKLRASRQVLSDYGNLSGGSVIFVMDEMRRKSKEEGLKTTGEGLEWGVLFGFGPGITVETLVLRSVAVAV
ncbi:uncharacterized protein LOC124934514 [Impatiens glandulifera]|uniref:uncharacterized protein LOC124934514 n=1 Tax=Impatiens glandulifera TaxID=253017 RepID=UPI001FB16F71|nr:uncharacterized protein LOC124934514 [Impatiens glandulifera]